MKEVGGGGGGLRFRGVYSHLYCLSPLHEGKHIDKRMMPCYSGHSDQRLSPLLRPLDVVWNLLILPFIIHVM